jgi:rubredoxin
VALVVSISDSKRYKTMEKYVCTVCGYEYDPEIGDPDSGIAPGTPFEDMCDSLISEQR